VARINKWALRLSVVPAIALTSGMVTAGGADAAASVSVPYECRTYVQGNTHPVLDYARGFAVTAPATVRKHDRFDVTYDADPITAYAEYNKIVTNVKFAYRIPAGLAVKKLRLSGGSGLGTSKNKVKVQGDDIVQTSSGPFEGGVPFDLPTLKVTFKAKTKDVDVAYTVGGSSYADPGFYWYRYQPILKEWGGFECFPDPAKPTAVLATTHVKK